MTKVRFILALFATLAFATPSTAQYYRAETARSEDRSIPAEAMASAGTDSATPIVEMAVSDLLSAETEEKVLESGIDRLAVQSEGHNYALRTFAEIQINAITGKSRFEGFDPVYVALSMVYNNASWVRAPILPVEHPDLAKALGLPEGNKQRVSPVYIMKTERARMLVMGRLQQMEATGVELSAGADKALTKLANRLAIFLNMPGELRLTPVKSLDYAWISPSNLDRPDVLENRDFANKIASLDPAEPTVAALANLNAALKSTLLSGDSSQLEQRSSELLAAANETGQYMPDNKRNLDYWTTVIHPFKRAAQIFMLAFFGFLIYIARSARKNKNSGPDAPAVTDEPVPAPAPQPSEGISLARLGQPAMELAGADGRTMPVVFDNRAGSTPGEVNKALMETRVARGEANVWWWLGYAPFLLATIAMLMALAGRAFLSGRMPVSNMYESMTFAMGGFAVIAAVFEGLRRRGWIGLSGALAGWAIMTAANSMSMQSRKIEPLVAVLNSVWLNFHVTTLLLSYSFFLMAFLAGILFLISNMPGKRSRMLPQPAELDQFIYQTIQLGWPLLTLGILLGAVWADTAWGKAWSWDPKETWALITWFVYTIYLHMRMVMGLKGRPAVLINIVGFVMVLITYYGVSYLPGLAGGMHSYAEPIKR